MMRYDILFLLSCYTFILFGGLISPNNNRQTQNYNSIMKTNIINPLNTDFVYNLPVHNYNLCPLLHNYVWSTRILYKDRPISRVPAYMVSHDFTKFELNNINKAFIELIYTPKNYPLTHRNKINVNIDNSTANQIYYLVCKDYYRGEPSPTMPIIFSIGMVTAVSLYFFGII